MRVFVALIGIFILTVLVSFQAHSEDQEENKRRVYGGSGSTSTPNIFNSPGSSHGTGGPISLKQIIEGRDRPATGDRYRYYGDRVTDPYTINDNSYALNITSDQVSAYREQRNAYAQARAEQAREEFSEFHNIMAQNESQTFNPRSGSNVNPQGRPRSVYIKRDKGFDVPKRVFRSVR